ncbi:MAG: hypothetical protein M0P18_10660, partial [Syntrophales bacterium]|nr:hypothetical protein [Syntrophales bacterium]
DLTSAGSGTQSLTPAKAAPVSAGGSLGIGASVALDISNTTVVAEIADSALITGAMNDMILSADSVTGSTVTSTAGGEAKGGSGVGIGGAVSIAIANNETRAYIGSGDELVLGGDLSVSATHRGSTVTKADGAASGGSAAIGVALGLNVVTDSTLATTERDIDAGGDVTFKAHSAASTTAEAKASAAGAEGEKDDGSTPSNGVDKQVGDQRGLADKKAEESGKTGSGTTKTPKAETSDGAVSVAAAVGVNVALSEMKAYISDNGRVKAGGTLTLSSSGNADAAARADGKAVDPDKTSVGIGAGIVVNYAEVTNTAFIGTGADVTADGVVIEAVMTRVDKPFDLTDVNDTRGSIVLGADHGLHTGDAVIYDNGGETSIGGLTGGETYYVVLDDTRTFNIFPDSLADVSDKIPGYKEFDAAGKLDTDADTIDLGAGHGFMTGLAVTYSKGGDDNTAIGGLTDGTTYYVITVSGTNKVKLADSIASAIAGTAIDLTGAGSGTHRLTPFWDSELKGNVSYSNNRIDVGADHSLKDGDLVVYSKGNMLNTKALGGLTDGATYMVKVVEGSSTHIQLLDAKTKQVQDITFSVEDVLLGCLFDHKLTIVKPTAVKLAATAADAFNKITLELDKTEATGSDHTLVEVSHHFRAEAESGAGASKVGVAGSLALNIITNHTEALIKSGAKVAAGNGDIMLNAVNIQGNAATAAAKVSGGDVGVGASVALNVLPVNITRAEIEDTAILTGGNNLTLSASSDHAVLTTAKAGAAGGTAISPVVAVAYVEDATTARFGTLAGSALSLAGNVTVQASHTGAAHTTVDASVAGDKVAVGAAVGIAIIDSSVLATVARDFSAAGDATIFASTAQSSTMEVMASAKGNKSEDEGGKDSDSEAQAQADGATGGKKTLPKTQDNLDTANDKATSNTAGNDGEGTGSAGVGVAAGIGVNWVVSENTASIADDVQVTAGGAVGVNAENETDLSTKVLGAAISFDNDTSVGAAVALNVADVTNRASIGAGADVEADGITVRAVTPTGQANTFTTWALAVGGGKDYGVAGSAGVNVVIMDTEASIGQGVRLTSRGDIDVEARNTISYQNLAGGGGVGKKAGVGIAVAANILTLNTDAVIGDSVHADAKSLFSVRAHSSITPLGLDIPGLAEVSPEISSIAAGGGVSTGGESTAAVGGSAIVDVIIQNTHAVIGDNARINVTDDFAPGADQSIRIDASGITRIVNGAGGLAVAAGGTGVGIGLNVGVIVKDTRASIGHSAVVQAGKDVTIKADSEEDIASAALSAGISKENGVAGALAVFVLTGTTQASIDGRNGRRSTVSAGGDLSVAASNRAEINTIALGVAASGKTAVGMAGAVNVITGTVVAEIAGADIDVVGDLSISASSSPVIRSMGIGGSVSGKTAVTVAGLGNVIVNRTEALISGGSMVTAGGDVRLSARDQAGFLLPSWMMAEETQEELTRLLEDSESPIDLRSSILAVNVSIAGSGQTAVGVSFTGNVVTNTVKADISGSTVLAGVNPDSYAIENSNADVFLDALTEAAIVQLTIGVGASGKTAIQATGFGNVITNTTGALIVDSTVYSGGAISLKAVDESKIAAVGLSIAASGGTAVSAIVGANVIVNSISTLISGSTVTSGAATNLLAESKVDIFGFSGGVAFSISGEGTSAAVGASIAVNIISNTVSSSIVDSNATSDGTITVHAEENDKIRAITIGGAASGSAGGTSVAIGASIAYNMIDNDVAALIAGSTVESTGGDIRVQAVESSMINAVSAAASLSVGIGGTAVSGAGAMAGNVILTRTNSSVQGSVLVGAGDVEITAESIPGSGPLDNLDVAVADANDFAAKLDDAGFTDQGDDEEQDIADDQAFLDVLSGKLSDRDIGNSGSLAVTVRTEGSEWAVTDRVSGENYIITRDGDAFRVAMPSITAVVIAASAAVSAGGSAGVSIGVSFAANLIGWDLGSADDYDPRYTTGDTPQTLTKGDRVEIEEGVREGYVYEYIGETVDLYDYTTGDGTQTLASGDLVKVNEGYDAGGTEASIYRYVGTSGSINLGVQDYTDDTLWESVGSARLSTQDYGNTDLWRQVNLQQSPVEVQACALNSSITAVGDVAVTAVSSKAIDALVVAGSAAASGGSSGVAVSGAGAGAMNTIAT